MNYWKERTINIMADLFEKDIKDAIERINLKTNCTAALLHDPYRVNPPPAVLIKYATDSDYQKAEQILSSLFENLKNPNTMLI